MISSSFVEQRPWHNITMSLDPVSCNKPTSFSPCLFDIVTFCCSTTGFWADRGRAILTVTARLKGEKKRTCKAQQRTGSERKRRLGSRVNELLRPWSAGSGSSRSDGRRQLIREIGAALPDSSENQSIS
uniref:Uncharacterized protein n=1 Tax=Salix viminalis TaxID=40686 RepID=A0A6N2M803_SALVM